MNAHGQDVPQVEKRADQFNSTDQSCIEILSLHTPVKSNCVGMLTMHEAGKSNLLAENK